MLNLGTDILHKAGRFKGDGQRGNGDFSGTSSLALPVYGLVGWSWKMQRDWLLPFKKNRRLENPCCVLFSCSEQEAVNL